MAAAANRGCFIVFEGLDRTGKTTQSGMLTSFLQEKGLNVHHMNFPDRTTQIGQSINAYLQNKSELDDHVIHLLFAANRWELQKKIIEKLNAGEHIICDRYSYSGVCYTSAKEKPGMDIDWCWNPEIGLPQPDLILFLDLSPEAAKERASYGEERYEKAAFQLKVREKFHEIIKRNTGGPWNPIDASQTINEIHEIVCAQAMGKISSVDPEINFIGSLGEKN